MFIKNVSEFLAKILEKSLWSLCILSEPVPFSLKSNFVTVIFQVNCVNQQLFLSQLIRYMIWGIAYVVLLTLFESCMCNRNESLNLEEITAWPLNFKMSSISALPSAFNKYTHLGASIRFWRSGDFQATSNPKTPTFTCGKPFLKNASSPKLISTVIRCVTRI